MADCPGTLHLAQMADGGLARLRFPGGALTAGEARAVARAAETHGSGEIDLTNRANLQIRGLAPDAGPAIAQQLERAGLRFYGEADRRRNILLDPFSGLDPTERRDMRPLASALEAAIVAAPWIERLSPKFSFVLDGGGATGVSAAPSDVAVRAGEKGIVVEAAGTAVLARGDDDAVRAMTALALAAADAGPRTRAADLSEAVMAQALADFPRSAPRRRPPALAVRFGAVPATVGLVALTLPVSVGRLDVRMLRWLADLAEADGESRLVLAPWSAVVLPFVSDARAADILARSTAQGFTPVAVAERLGVVACAGAPACERAREPAKALGAAVLRLAAERSDLLPARRTSLHLSGCGKGCAGSAPADLLLLGASERAGWSVHRDSVPRAPGVETDRLDAPSAAELLDRLRRGA